MPESILVHRNKQREIISAVIYPTSSGNANKYADGKILKAYTAKQFNQIYSAADMPKKTKKPDTQELQDWIEKIREAGEPQRGGRREAGKGCSDELNTPEDQKNRKKVSWQVNSRTDIRDLMIDAAKKRGYTVTGLAETVFIDWLNKNELSGKKQIKRTPANSTNTIAYRLGQLAAKEREIYGAVNLNEYVFEIPGTHVTAVKKDLIKQYKYTQDVGDIISSIPKSGLGVPLHERNYIWFFAGFCGVDWKLISDQKFKD